MVHKLTPLRPSLTALTAVLVLSATPAFAQTTDTSTSPAPITIAPPAPTVTTDAPAATTPDATPAPTVDTTSNMSAQDSAAPATSPAPAAPMATRSPVVVHTTADTSDAAPAAAPVATAKVARTAKPAPVAESKPAPAHAPVAKVAPAPAPAPQPEVAPAQPAPVVTSNKTVATSTTHDETGLYAGLGGAAALLLIGGGAFAISRRRKDEDEDEADDYVAAEPAIVPAATRVEPTYEPVVASVATPVTESAPIGESTLPEGFDLSRFGPHTQAAYRGPTEDNPSYSLKKRLKIASFRDGRLRQGLETDVPVPSQQAVEEEAPSRTLLGSKLTDKLSFRPSRPRQSFRPATA